MKYLRKFNEKDDVPWASRYRLGPASKDTIPVTKDNLPKQGDKVRCIPGFTSIGGGQADLDHGGGGYEPNKIFIVRVVTNDGGGGGRPIIWPEGGGSGVYFNALEYVYN